MAHQQKDRFKTCLFCWRILRAVRGTAVTLPIGNVKSAVVRIRVSEYSRLNIYFRTGLFWCKSQKINTL